MRIVEKAETLPLSGCLCLGSCVDPGKIRDNLVKTKVKRAKGSWCELERPRAHETLQGTPCLFLYILASPQSYLLYVVSFCVFYNPVLFFSFLHRQGLSLLLWMALNFWLSCSSSWNSKCVLPLHITFH